MPTHVFPTALGACSIAWEDIAVTGFGLLRPPGRAEPTPPPDWVAALVTRVKQHLENGAEDFADAPLAWDRVSEFQARVYRAALKVKAGHTATYGDLARAIGEGPVAARAIGTALGQNPWPLLVPCHRFVGADGHMTGFSAPGGIKTKLRLLALEGSELFAD